METSPVRILLIEVTLSSISKIETALGASVKALMTGFCQTKKREDFHLPSCGATWN